MSEKDIRDVLIDKMTEFYHEHGTYHDINTMKWAI